MGKAAWLARISSFVCIKLSCQEHRPTDHRRVARAPNRRNAPALSSSLPASAADGDPAGVWRWQVSADTLDTSDTPDSPDSPDVQTEDLNEGRNLHQAPKEMLARNPPTQPPRRVFDRRASWRLVRRLRVRASHVATSCTVR